MCILHVFATKTENWPVGFHVYFRRLAEIRLCWCTGRPFGVLEKLYRRGRSCTFFPIGANTASLKVVPRPLFCNRISLDVRRVRLGTGLESRRSSIFYTVAPRDILKSPLRRLILCVYKWTTITWSCPTSSDSKYSWGFKKWSWECIRILISHFIITPLLAQDSVKADFQALTQPQVKLNVSGIWPSVWCLLAIRLCTHKHTYTHTYIHTHVHTRQLYCNPLLYMRAED